MRSDRFWIQVIIFSIVSSGGWISSWPPLLVFWPLTNIPGTTGWPLVAPELSRTSRSLFIWMMTLEGTGALGSCSTNSSFGSNCLGFVFSRKEKDSFQKINLVFEIQKSKVYLKVRIMLNIKKRVDFLMWSIEVFKKEDT